VVSSTTLQNDDHLAFPIAANETWSFVGWLIVTSASGTPDLRLAFTVPAGATLRWSGFGDGNTGADHEVIVTSGFTDVFQLTGAAWRDWVQVRGIVSNGANAGTVQMQWAQNLSNPSAVTIQAGSHVQASRY
jgi:hypothetical protein